MMLPLTVFAQLAASCAPDVAVETLSAIARTESSFDPLVIGDNTTRQSHHPQDQAEAIRTATTLLAAGHSLDLGIMQINNSNMNWVGLTVETAFDPCQNIRAGATVLTAFSRYNTGSPTRGFRNGYVQKVVANMSGLGLAPTRRSPPPVPATPSAPIPPTIPPPVGQSWGAFHLAPPTNNWSAFGERGEQR